MAFILAPLSCYDEDNDVEHRRGCAGRAESCFPATGRLSLAQSLASPYLVNHASARGNIGHDALLALVAGLTLGLSLAAPPINRLLLHQPGLLVIDLLLSAVLVWYTDVERSPYYLYSLAPILAAAFFFRIRGGLLAAAVYTSFYLLAVFVAPRSSELPVSMPVAVGQIISFFLIGVIFGYPSLLLQRLRHAHAELTSRNVELSQRNRDLDLT